MNSKKYDSLSQLLVHRLTFPPISRSHPFSSPEAVGSWSRGSLQIRSSGYGDENGGHITCEKYVKKMSKVLSGVHGSARSTVNETENSSVQFPF